MKKENLRLINIIAELYQCDPGDIIWDDSGSADTVIFDTDDTRYLMKMSRDNIAGTPANCVDFRVRVMVGGQ